MKLFFTSAVILFFLNFLNAQLYINEVSQGTGNKEYVELIVAGTPSCGDSTVNLQGWILDDNCGFFGTTGIAGGHIKFTNDPQWANIKYGTLITIYRGDDIFPGITPDETDANNDDVFVLPSSSNFFDRNENIPSGGGASAISTYTNTGYLNGGGSWDMLGMSNSSDAFQTVAPTDLTSTFHSVGWGNGISGTDIHFNTSASGLSFVNQNLADNDPRNQANWVSVAAITMGTPASLNSPPNGMWIAGLLAQSAGTGYSLIENDTICFGDSVFLENTWQTTTGVYYDTIPANGGGTAITDTLYTETFDGPLSWVLNTTLFPAQNGSDPNFWTINDNEAGVSPPLCGSTGGGNKTLHITSVFNPLSGAAYDAGGLCGLLFCPLTNTDVTSSNISTFGHTNIVLTFDYIADGQALLDKASVLYSDNGGISFSILDNNLKSTSPTACLPQGEWTAASYILPVSTENISNLQIRFNWTNNDDGAGSDPSVAINDVRISGDVLSSGGSCDTILETNLTVLPAPIELVADLIGCDSVIHNGIAYYTSTDFFTDSLFNSMGCLTSYTNVGIDLHFTVNTSVSTTICANDSVFLAGDWQNTAGTYYDTLQTGAFPNCDSIITTTLSINNFSEATINASICANDSVFLAGAWQNTANTYNDTFTTAGCDSIIHTVLSITTAYANSVNVQYCFGDIFNYILPDGLVVNTTGIYVSTVLNIGLCDSVITTNISYSTTPLSNTLSICTNTPANVGTVTDTVLNLNNCDSVYGITNTYLITPTNASPITTCTTDPTQVGTSNDTIFSIGACDSLYLVNTTVLISPFYVSASDLCTNILSNSGIDTVLTQQSVGGCDSLFTITETIYEPINIQNSNTEICQGEDVLIFGVLETQAGTYSQTITSVLGCDSITENITLIVNLLPNIDAGSDETIVIGNTVTISAEGGDSYLWNTNESTQAISISPVSTTTYFVTGTDVNNCQNSDSVQVIVLPLDVEIQIPTAFSPNNDGVNDVFRIVNETSFENINLRIYNRWGENVFQSETGITSWDGTYKNIDQELDSYVYYIDATDKGSQKELSISGSFALIR